MKFACYRFLDFDSHFQRFRARFILYHNYVIYIYISQSANIYASIYLYDELIYQSIIQFDAELNTVNSLRKTALSYNYTDVYAWQTLNGLSHIIYRWA